MTRMQMLKVMQRHRGELSRLAERADVRLSTVGKWFRNPKETSANIESKVRSRVKELLLLEKDEREKRTAEDAVLQSLNQQTTI